MGRYCGTVLVGLFLFVIAGCATTMKAEVDIARGRYEEAIQVYQEYFADNPGSARDRSRYGYALLKTNRGDEAIIQLKKSLELKPGEPYAIVYLGMAYLNQGEFDKAARTWGGYPKEKMPLVEKEIKRLLTTVLMAQAQKEAEKALASEGQLGVKAPNANTIAVGYFKDMSSDKSLRAFQKGLTAMLITDISKISPFKVVEREKLQALLEEMKLGQTGIVDEKTAPRVGRLLRAENMVTGSLSRGSIEAVVGVASTGDAGLKRGSAVGRTEEKKFFELPHILIEKIFKILQVKISQDQRTAIGIPHTKNYQAFIYYGNGLDALDQGNWPQARDLFAKAMQKDPKFGLARDAYEATPGDLAPTIQSIKSLDLPMIFAAAEKSIDLTFRKEAEAKALLEEAKRDSGGGSDGGGGGGGGGGHGH